MKPPLRPLPPPIHDCAYGALITFDGAYGAFITLGANAGAAEGGERRQTNRRRRLV